MKLKRSYIENRYLIIKEMIEDFYKIENNEYFDASFLDKYYDSTKTRTKLIEKKVGKYKNNVAYKKLKKFIEDELYILDILDKIYETKNIYCDNTYIYRTLLTDCLVHYDNLSYNLHFFEINFYKKEK